MALHIKYFVSFFVCEIIQNKQCYGVTFFCNIHDNCIMGNLWEIFKKMLKSLNRDQKLTSFDKNVSLCELKEFLSL